MDVLVLLICVCAIQSLSPALMDIKKMCYQISDTGLCHMEKKHTYTLQEFQEAQLDKLQEVQLCSHAKIGPV